MDARQKAFWEAVGADGPVPVKDLLGRIDNVLIKYPEFVCLEGVSNFIVFSGSIMHGNAEQAAVDLAKRANGSIGIIYDTLASQAIFPFIRLTSKIGSLRVAAKIVNESREAFQAKYKPYIDIPDLSDLNAQLALGHDGWELYKSISAHFARNIKGNVITITPEASPHRIFAHFEVPHIADGLRPDSKTGIRRVTHINGMTADRFDVTLAKLPQVEGTPLASAETLLRQHNGKKISAYEPIRLEFGVSFKENFRKAGGRVWSDGPI